MTMLFMDKPVTRFTRLARSAGVIAGAWIVAWAVAGVPSPAGAAEGRAPGPQASADRQAGAAQPAPGELAREGLAKMLQALDAMVQSVPQYHMPEVTENGDIIIRRKWPDQAPTPAPTPPRRQPAPAEKGPGMPI